MTEHEAPLGHSPEQQERLSADYSFVFCYHTTEFADQISTALQDCDTVALEYLGFQSEAERQSWNEKLTTYVAGTATEQQDADVQDELEKSAGGAYLGTILEKLRGTNKKIVLLDIDEDNPNYGSVTDYWAANRAYYGAVGNGSPVDEVKQASKAFIQAAVDSFPVREGAMAEQLKGLGRVPGKVGVVTGVIHTPILDKLSGIAETSSTVIGPDVKITNGVTTVEYDDLDVAIQQARANGMDSIDDTLLNRGILKDLIASYDVDLGDHNLRDLVNDLQPAEVNSLLQKIDEVRSAGSQYKAGFFRLMMTKNDIIDALQTVWPTIGENSKLTIRKVH